MFLGRCGSSKDYCASNWLILRLDTYTHITATACGDHSFLDSRIKVWIKKTQECCDVLGRELSASSLLQRVQIGKG